MSYKVLARKWRPQHFRDMLGQEPVLRALINALDSDRLHHAYLFTGMRGVGKTTIARILAKCLNCETNGVSASPCGECSACRDIEAGRFFDLIEVDAASRTKVEETRELLENVPYAPSSGRYKVYLIDEVHMFSNHSFNALLKTLEEPPEHVKFLLATTDPQKVPVTVLSRCLQFNLKRMAPGLLADYLSKILTEESIEHERPALDLIARASEGSVRDSLSLVEQAAAFGEGAVRETDVENMLGRASVDRLLSLIESLGQGDLLQLFEQVEALADYAPDFSELMGELLSLLHRIALLQAVPGSVPDDAPGHERLQRLSVSLLADEVQLYYQIGMHARRDMPFAPDPREAFDMALLRMHAFRPQASSVGQGGATGGPESSATVPAEAVATAPHSSAPVPGVSTAASTPASTTAATVAASTPATPNDARAAALAAVATAGIPVRGEVSAGSLRAAAMAALQQTPEQSAAAIQRSNSAEPAASASAAAAAAAAATPALAPAPAPADNSAANSASGVASSASSAAQDRSSGAVAQEASGSENRSSSMAATRQSVGQSGQSSGADQGSVAIESVGAESVGTEAAGAEAIEDSRAHDPDPVPAQTPASKLDRQAIAPSDWPQIVNELDISGMPRQLACHCELIARESDLFTLSLEATSDHLNTPRFSERLQAALAQWLGQPVRLAISLADGQLTTPARLEEQNRAQEMAAARQSIDQDPLVRQLIDRVDGSVDETSIAPLGDA